MPVLDYFLLLSNIVWYGEATVCLFISQSVGIWVVHLLVVMNNADVNIYIHVFVQMHFWLLLSIYLGVEFLGHGNSVFNFLRYCQIVFQSHYTTLYLNQQCMRVLIPPQPGQYLLICYFDYCLSPGCKVIFHCVLICFSWMLNDSIFSFADWSFVKFLWKNICSYSLPILALGYLFIVYL